mgnify:FL=1
MTEDERKKLKKRFLISGGVGSLLLGSGLSALIECGFLKHSEAPNWQWIAGGTLSLIILMSGVNLLFDSFHHKLKLEKEK